MSEFNWLEFVKKHKYKITLAVILIITAIFRFYKITEMPPGLYPDEAMNGNNALEAIATGQYKIFYPENNGREGLFINIQSLAVNIFGNEPWALRLISALFGFFTVLGTYLLTRELSFKTGGNKIMNRIMDWELSTEISRSEIIALLTTFFLSVSFWHTNFSRIGFRAIMLPFITVFSFYFLFKGFRTKKVSDFIWSGVFLGMGFHTYIAFRVVPVVALFVVILKLIEMIKSHAYQDARDKKEEIKRFIYSVIVYGFFAFLVALPLVYYFYQNPGDFIGRAGQVAVTASSDPINDLIKSSFLTFAQFNLSGDFNWRHNYSGDPLLMWPIGIFFLVGIISSIKKIFKFCKQFLQKLPYNPIPLKHAFLLSWFLAMLAPSILSTEGLPHALRSIGAIPPTFIFAGLGAYAAYGVSERYLFRYSDKRLSATLYAIFLLAILIASYDKYFMLYAGNSNTKGAFADNYVKIGRFLNTLPPDTNKYVIVNAGGTLANGVPIPAQTTMYVTDSYRTANQFEKHIFYVQTNELDKQDFSSKKPYVVVPLDHDENLLNRLRSYAPGKTIKEPDFSYIINN